LTHDTIEAARVRTGAGLGFALVSAASFGLSGALARGLMDAGWSAASAVAVRVLVGALVLLPAAVVALRGRWWLLRQHAGRIASFGLVAVAGCQLAYFNAVAHMQVGVALLIEYTSPVAVIAWLWLRRGERPLRTTVVGALVAAVGLVLVLDLLSGAEVSLVGVLWALAAMVGVSYYWLVSADEDGDLPGIVLATGGLLLGGAVLLIAGLVGALPWSVSTTTVHYDGHAVAWWLPVLGLGLFTASISYVTGIAGIRRLGARVASFVGLSEVLSALFWAWLLLGELPRPVQIAGGTLIVVGVVLVKLGERDTGAQAPVSARPDV
jgi:drug/metabolite transporter (DMT)-like permease